MQTITRQGSLYFVGHPRTNWSSSSQGAWHYGRTHFVPCHEFIDYKYHSSVWMWLKYYLACMVTMEGVCSLQHDLPYHTSAILAACLDTMTLPYRLESQPSLMTHMIQALTPLSRKASWLRRSWVVTSVPLNFCCGCSLLCCWLVLMLAFSLLFFHIDQVSCLQAAFPFPMSNHGTLVNTLTSLGDSLPWQPLTPMCQREAVTDGQSVVLRGVPNARLKGWASHSLVRFALQGLQNSSIFRHIDIGKNVGRVLFTAEFYAAYSWVLPWYFVEPWAQIPLEHYHSVPM